MVGIGGQSGEGWQCKGEDTSAFGSVPQVAGQKQNDKGHECNDEYEHVCERGPKEW